VSKQTRAGWGLWLACALCASGYGCAVGPDYTRPDVKTPEQHRGQSATEKSAAAEKSLAELPWWDVFRDPTLARHLKQSLTNAYDVRMAVARIEQARAQAKAAMWAFFPSFGARIGLSTSEGIPAMVGSFGATASASWEADVWGRLRRQKEAADAMAQAADEDRRAVYVALAGDVASTYLRLRTNDLKLEIVEDAIKTRQETTQFFTDRFNGGVGSELEVSRAQANLADASAQSAGLRQGIWFNENQLAFLTARPLGGVERGAALDALALAPEIPAGLPSALLERRPDIRRAEAQLHAATAVVGVRIGDVLPKLALTGLGGVASTDLGDLTGSAQGVYHVSAGIDIPIPLLGGAGALNAIDAAKSRVKELAAGYEKVVMNALREVSDALMTVEQLKLARVERETQTAALRHARDLAMLRYRGGVANYLEVVTAEEARLGAELMLADVKGDQQQAVVQLYRALGGGWQMGGKAAEEKPAKPQRAQ
jgi:multidrug efflux system outer membrane protein